MSVENLVAVSSADAPKAPEVTLLREFVRVMRVWPDWLFGMLSSMGIGLAAGAFVYWNPAKPVHDPLTVVITTVLTAVADSSLTNQLAAEPDWAARVLGAGGDPARLLRARNQLLYIFEAAFAFAVGGAVVLLTHQHHWVDRNWPIVAELPLASIAVGNIVSVLLPCPFMRLRHRLQVPTTWPRWGAYVAIPFALTSLGTLMVMALPSYLERQISHSAESMPHRPPWLTGDNIHFATWLIMVPILNLMVWAIALKAADAVARPRRHHLVELMNKHSALVAGCDDLSLWRAIRALPRILREIPEEVRAAADARIEEIRAVGGHIDRGLEHALALQAAKVRAAYEQEAAGPA